MGGSWLLRLVRSLTRQEGNVSAIVALMLIPMVGVFGMATESSSWFLIQRAAQNAADAAALAAASNDCDPLDACHVTKLSASYADEAQAVAARYAFDPTIAANKTTVVAQDKVTCPAPSTTSDCYKVTITKLVPIYLLGIVGYTGDAANPGYQNVVARAIATKPIPAEYCMVALAHGASSGTSAFTLNGGNTFDAGGCDLFSNASSTCNGHDGGFGISTTIDPSPNKLCGAAQSVASSPLADPYLSLQASIPSPASCTPIASPSSSGPLNVGKAACVTISGNFTIPTGVTATMNTASPGTVLLITGGGNLVLNGALTAAAGSGLTIIFTGTSGAPGFITGGNNGVLDYGAPASGTWAGIAIYQNPNLTTKSSQTYTGNKPTFNITGIVYAPYVALTVKGAINHQTSGYACLGFVTDTFLTSGTGSIFALPTSECRQAGVTLPNVPGSVAFRQALVQ